MPGLKHLAIALLAIVPASCASDSSVGPAQESGTLAAAASAGGILGGPIGASLDQVDRQRAYAAEMQALEHGEPGEPVGWRGDGKGPRGTVVPGGYYETRGNRCRDYSHTIYIDGRPQIARATACRTPDGRWGPLG